ncbi:uncharacterized protein PV09_06279 [Verruconis gallopava]|uniref:INO80 complex subunit F domain-containing protein n=1 Tax=Verruconis gallopava TaxID=253628 RepID=A0A0D2A6X2_9PEZI|nr:uncharacterized protein PV09_06279 [Verruconis gallopava]KIW02473.1 hypothetical protein PV09_06279 [Verruconis gallopava]
MASKALHDRVMHGVSSNSPLPPSVETAYYRKCIELKRRINEIEENNDTLRVKKMRIERAILKMRLERAMLLEQIAAKMKDNPDDSDDSNSPPPTVSVGTDLHWRARALSHLGQPQDRPLRSKRAHRKTTPPPAGGTNAVPASSPVPQSTSGAPANSGTAVTETPDAARSHSLREYVPTSAEATPAPANGTPVQLPSLSSQLPPSVTPAPAATPQSAPSGFAAIDNPAPQENGDTEMAGAGDR